MLHRAIEVDFERIVPEGKSAGKAEGKNIYALGVLPGERAVVEIFRKKKRFAEGRVLSLLSKSTERIDPLEDHYLTCSPWQIMNYEYQVALKKQIIERCYKNIAYEEVPVEKMWAESPHTGYRTKMEYGITDFDGTLGLTFHHRGEHFKKHFLKDGCVLGSKKINEIAQILLKYLQSSEECRTLFTGITLRESKTEDKVIVVLLTPETVLPESIISILNDAPVPNLFVVHQPVDRSVRLMETPLFAKGDTFLTEKIASYTISYPYNAFFQNNVPGISAAIEQIKAFLPQGGKLIELYSGVGTLGIPCAQHVDEVIGIEIGNWAKDWAEKNAKSNGVNNYHVEVLQAEKTAFEYFQGADTVLLDPPRPGLHKKVVRMLREAKPKRIIYLSCNPITQARDYSLLSLDYKPIWLSGYDFYPNTVHVESLLVLERK